MAEQDKQGHFWINVWFGVSVLMNLSGMASIADGFVTWAKFFHDIIDVYRAVIRQPLAWIGHLIWPFGPIPGWVFDVFVIWMALFLAANISNYRDTGRTFLGELRDAYNESGIVSAFFGGLLIFIFTPIYLILLPIGLGGYRDTMADNRRQTRDILVNFILILALFMLILFINWQIRQHGG